MGNSDNVIGYIEYLSDDGKTVGYVTPFTDVDKFRKEILKAAEVGMPITPVVFPIRWTSHWNCRGTSIGRVAFVKKRDRLTLMRYTKPITVISFSETMLMRKLV